METYFEATPDLVQESAIALGFFDGVHPGHQVVIGSALAEARRLGIKSGVVTFKDHPRLLTRGQSPLLLTVIEQRLKLFESLGVDTALVLSFTEELCQLSPHEYVQNVLVSSMGAKAISVGHNHHFGRDREGDAGLLRELGSKLGFSVNVSRMVHVEGVEVSSSRIRDYVGQGRMREAEALLSRPFSVYGKVIEGDGRGRTIGFPTANLELFEYQMIPRRGVYAGLAKLDRQSDVALPCVINVGKRPTFRSENKEASLMVEAHLLAFDENLYGKKLEISFLEFIRQETRFSSPEALVGQISRDIDQAKNILERACQAGEKPSGQKLPA